MLVFYINLFLEIKKPNKNQILFGKVMTVNNLAF